MQRSNNAYEDLTNGTYKPYRKPNDEPLYINRSSNHPPSIIRELPGSINRRINKLSSNKDTFYTAAPIYNEALNEATLIHHLNTNHLTLIQIPNVTDNET